MFSITRVIRFIRRGVGISDTDVEYADSTSSTVAPTTGWQTTAPTWQNGHFIWSRTHIIYTDGTDKYTDPVCLPSGKGIDRIVEQYYSSTSSTSLTGGSWSEAVPSWIDGRYIWTRSVIYYTDGTSQDTSPVCTTGGKGPQGDPGEDGDPGKDGKDGVDGKDAITITMSLTAICHKKTADAARYTIETKMFEGDEQVSFLFSIQGIDGASVTSTARGKDRLFYVNIPANAEPNGKIALSFSYKDKTYVRNIPVTTVKDGEQGHKGEVGAIMRGPQSWSDLGEGYSFESGGEGDEWKDVVIYKNIYYSCIENHVKTADNYPGSDEDDNNSYWRAGSPIEIIATQILLSKFAFIDNLGAKAIRMYSEDGKELLFEAYNGKLTCKTGTFENVSVSGDIKADSGYVGGFTIQQNQLHSATDGYSFDIYKDRLVYVDQKNQRTLTIMSDDSDGLRLSMGAAKDNSICYLTVGDRGIGLVSSNGKGFKSEYNERCMSVSQNNCGVTCYINTSFGSLERGDTFDAGIKCMVNSYSKKMRLWITGLPDKDAVATAGEVYIDNNGFLKVKLK